MELANFQIGPNFSSRHCEQSKRSNSDASYLVFTAHTIAPVRFEPKSRRNWRCLKLSQIGTKWFQMRPMYQQKKYYSQDFCERSIVIFESAHNPVFEYASPEVVSYAKRNNQLKRAG
ncbi:hypothetical protein CLIB1423_20S00342 [[Candida] railenensis]|uniref:Uncharacterized protein n=1 Tax=[Candida] railenensis TaxID=45579 RepID=A0A9P0QUS2_9ASCO|nr:hypothetical protein CLIB1423_20S00342 [[Candida] railenensis]